MNLKKQIDELKKNSKKYGINPSSLKGQNFLIDEFALNSIVEKSDIKPSDNILEIGPGFGVLTDYLLDAKKVIAIELEKGLCHFLKEKYKDINNFNLINKNILNFDNVEIKKLFDNEPYRIIANIPYSISGKFFKKFVSDTHNKPKDIYVLVQKEVAQRICCKIPNMNLLGLSVQLYANPSIEFLVSAQSFWPKPKIDSAYISIRNIRQKPLYRIQDIKKFWQIVHIGFSSPRKQLHNNLHNGLKIESNLIKKAFGLIGVKEKSRAQEISIEKWIKLSEHLLK